MHDDHVTFVKRAMFEYVGAVCGGVREAEGSDRPFVLVWVVLL